MDENFLAFDLVNDSCSSRRALAIKDKAKRFNLFRNRTGTRHISDLL
ncbi:hypothetical protein ACO0LL_15425 [Undibacterium sp. TC4M20W]